MDDDNENEVEKGLIDTLEPVAVAEEEEAIPVSADMLPLTPELIASSLSLVARTAQGLSHAFTRLEIHEKEITNLNALETYPHLRYVDCSDNNLVNIEGLNNLKYLLALNLQNNYISSIPSGLDRREFLQHVNLAKNNFKDWTVNYWPMCSFLNLNENKLTESVTFDGYPELLHLELRANKFKATPEKLVAPKLQRLYLGANEISSIKFSELPTLQVLNLRANKIDKLEGFDKLPNLVYLNLRTNKVDSMAQIDNLINLRSLRILILIENPIEHTDSYRLEVVSRLYKLERLDKDQVSNEEREEAFALRETRRAEKEKV